MVCREIGLSLPFRDDNLMLGRIEVRVSEVAQNPSDIQRTLNKNNRISAQVPSPMSTQVKPPPQ